MPGERVVLDLRAHPVEIVLGVLGPVLALVAVGTLAAGLALRGVVGRGAWAVVLVASVLMAALLAWRWVEWLMREYLLTDRRVRWSSGVLRRLTVDAPLEKVQHAVLYRSLRERVFGLGTLGFATAGTDVVEVVWGMVDRPDEVLGAARGAIEGRRPGGGIQQGGMQQGTPLGASGDGAEPHLRPPVIGLVGGIGAGKSALASALGALGCVVVDSDREAKAVLDRPAVRAELARWWGAGVVGPDGRVDRGKVAAIVFGDDDERRRLEALVHPLVRGARAAAIEQARRSAAAGVVVDAPLLFEAGVDAECDLVVFVEADRDRRVARVVATRGWSEAELSRREAAQMPLEEKRRRSGMVVRNDGDAGALGARAAEVLAAARGRVV